MEAKRSEVEKVNMQHLSVEYRKEIIEALRRDMAQYADDPEALEVYELGIRNLLNSLD
jgi:hypothetical protein